MIEVTVKDILDVGVMVEVNPGVIKFLSNTQLSRDPVSLVHPDRPSWRLYYVRSTSARKGLAG